MMTRLIRYLPSLILLILTLIFVATAFDYSGNSRRVPLAVALVILILLAIDLASQNDRGLGQLLRRAFGGAQAVRPGQDGEPGVLAKEVAAILWIAGFTALAVVFGFYIAIPAYAIGYLVVYARRPWLISGLIAIGLTGLLYFLFAILLGYEIFVGLIFGGFM
jgi:hypothetical protein